MKLIITEQKKFYILKMYYKHSNLELINENEQNY